jgi:hypothetical protein
MLGARKSEACGQSCSGEAEIVEKDKVEITGTDNVVEDYARVS